MIVVDASLWFDLFNARDEARLRLAEKFFAEVEGLAIYEPALFRVELAGLLVRLNPRDVVEQLVEEIVSRIRVCTNLDEDAYRVAIATGSRAADAYYIACASKTSSILVSNDRVQVLSARRYGVEAYYLLGETEKALFEDKEAATAAQPQQR
ncbi:type II toxin-antitoxin system VapC family toxin [Pyrodictium abyssi]|uniref:Type II toxin-antitoxin system VapC family toxin n=1 Tax=Pyrodictium abyssi TaxID=54256 RepID=A0ABM8IW24_9CREN|nr:type II toxin-antitoxin system VapC family toxin [Pyrodictium abyssi]